eukprot:CAMPEP_0169109262 /NCGR_PEP_ID=MMETSP1015-20121227/25872_1 /TAXON_ID=342587 /ORGANISM="Karlodinium micrum, Strain CCMP2283" /LENGTH=430 /DNA_ID=CAMNT_0009170949 /DNA_START=52 /DNA_END=1344 /DNA_ORIENTATION=+
MKQFAILLLSQAFLCDGASFRAPRNTAETVKSVAMNSTIALHHHGDPVKIHDDISYEVVKKTSISRDGSSSCLCKLGWFWHWRINSCVKQGPWGYECGFFPAEHHDKVCMDGLKCEVLDQTRIKYVHPGAVPASCQECTKEDQCKSGEARHEETCLKEYALGGEACQTVRVTVTATAEVKVSEKVTKKGTASATATANATHTATSADGNHEATATAKGEGEATATAEASSTAEGKAKATEKGSAEGSACVSVEEVKEHLKLQDVPEMGAVLSSKVVATGDKLAFDKAYAKALEAAKKAGLLNAVEAAKALAKAQAREHAGLDAEANADEAAAWKAEAGAKKDAQEKANADALAKAQAEADAAAAAAAKVVAEMPGSEDAEAAAEEAAARADAIRSLTQPQPTEGPVEITTAEPTSPPRKITPEQVAAKLP